MKKIALVLLALMLAVGCAAAQELPFDAVRYELEDWGFSICLPEDWLEIELTDEDEEDGVIFCAMSPEGEHGMSIIFTDMEMELDTQALVEALEDSYSGVSVEEINDIEFVAATSAEDDSNLLCTVGASGQSVFMFIFTPASDRDFVSTSIAIAGSIDTL